MTWFIQLRHVQLPYKVRISFNILWLHLVSSEKAVRKLAAFFLPAGWSFGKNGDFLFAQIHNAHSVREI